MADNNDVSSNDPPVTPHNNPMWIRYCAVRKALKVNQPAVSTLSLPDGDNPATRSPERPIQTHTSASTQTTPSLTKYVVSGPVIKAEDDCFAVAECAFGKQYDPEIVMPLKADYISRRAVPNTN
jgi:hypothetical protein